MNHTTSMIASNIARGVTQDGGYLHFAVKDADLVFTRKLAYMATMPTLSAQVVEVLEEKVRKGYVLTEKLKMILKTAQKTQAREKHFDELFPNRKKRIN